LKITLLMVKPNASGDKKVKFSMLTVLRA
jgi:hypothetical protein